MRLCVCVCVGWSPRSATARRRRVWQRLLVRHRSAAWSSPRCRPGTPGAAASPPKHRPNATSESPESDEHRRPVRCDGDEADPGVPGKIRRACPATQSSTSHHREAMAAPAPRPNPGSHRDQAKAGAKLSDGLPFGLRARHAGPVVDITTAPSGDMARKTQARASGSQERSRRASVGGEGRRQANRAMRAPARHSLMQGRGSRRPCFDNPLDRIRRRKAGTSSLRQPTGKRRERAVGSRLWSRGCDRMVGRKGRGRCRCPERRRQARAYNLSHSWLRLGLTSGWRVDFDKPGAAGVCNATPGMWSRAVGRSWRRTAGRAQLCARSRARSRRRADGRAGR